MAKRATTRRKVNAPSAPELPPEAVRTLAPPQRSFVRRDMSAGAAIGMLPSQVDCAGCDSLCSRLPHSWRSTCLATCRSACSAGNRMMSVFR